MRPWARAGRRLPILIEAYSVLVAAHSTHIESYSMLMPPPYEQILADDVARAKPKYALGCTAQIRQSESPWTHPE